MEWVKGIIGMNYYWLISNCSFSSVFAFLLVLHLFYLCLLCTFSLCLSHCFFVSFFYTFNYSHLFCLYFSSVSSCLYLVFSHDVVWFLFAFFNIFHLNIVFTVRGDALLWHRKTLSWPTNNTFAKTVLTFSIYSRSFFSGCFLFWHGYSSIRFLLTIFNTKLIKRFHWVRMVFVGVCIVHRQNLSALLCLAILLT